jgi:ribosomal protein S12 methylthiotransferase accessory factor
MEAVETWHAENVRLPLHFSSLADLRRWLNVVDVDVLPRRPGRTFDPHAPLLWVEGHNLMDACSIWLPFEIVHADWRLSGPPTSGFFSMNTNGLASGNSLSEAVSHALCELIERDATSLWHQSPLAERCARRLDLATVDDPDPHAVIDRLNKVDLDVAVWEITTDVGVPTFQCLLFDRTGQIGHIGTGAACHPNKGLALLHAVLEAAQVRTTYIIGSREDIDPADYEPATLARRNSEARALVIASERLRDFRWVPSARFVAAEAEVDWLLDRLRSIGLKQAIAVDLTQIAYKIPQVCETQGPLPCFSSTVLFS